MRGDDRGRVHLPDMIVGTAVFAAIIAVVPIITSITSDVEFDAFTELMLTILGPTLFILLIVSIGVSAVRND